MTSRAARLSSKQKEEILLRSSAGEALSRIAQDYGVTR